MNSYITMNPEPHNPFYTLLVVAGFVFVVTALAYAVVPPERQPTWFWHHGWQLLLLEVAAVIFFGLASMVLDRIRTLRKPADSEKIKEENPSA